MTCANFSEDRLRGLGVAGGQSLPFSIDFDCHPYNTLALLCECVVHVVYATQKIPKKLLPAHHHTTLSGYILTTKAHINNRKKNFLSSNISSTHPHNMVNFGPLAAEVILVVWGTTANFNGFRILAALLHGTPAVCISQTAGLNRGRHLYLTGRPSRWALVHILVYTLLPLPYL